MLVPQSTHSRFDRVCFTSVLLGVLDRRSLAL
jgi:hypothetical protein